MKDNIIRGKKILILGASTWQVPYIIKAKELGLVVYATDWSCDAVGATFSDFFEAIDLKDCERSLDYAKKNNIDAIFTAADIGIPTAAFIAEKMNLPYHSAELALSATNKFVMRNKAKEIGLGIPEFSITDNLEEAIDLATSKGFPLIIKPVDNCSSRGVFVINNLAELIEIFDKSINASLAKKVLLEEFMSGTEGSVEALIDSGKPIILGVCDKSKSDLPYRYDLQLNYPGNYSSKQNELITEFITKLVNGFEIKEGIIHVEIMVTESSVRLIEFSIRGCGSNVITHLMPEMLGFDVMDYLIHSAFNIKKDIHFTKNLFGVLKFIMLQQGKIKNIEGLDEILKIKGIADCKIERKAGDVIAEIKDGRSRPGYIIAVSEAKEALDLIIDKALNKINVNYF